MTEQNLWQEDQTVKDLRFYFSVSQKIFLVGLGLILFFYLLSRVSFLAWNNNYLNYVSDIIIGAILLISSLRVAKRRHQSSEHAITVGSLVGIGLGLFHSILRTIWFWSWWQLVGLVVEPLAWGVVGFILGIILTKIWQIKNKIEAAKSIDTPSSE